MCEKYRSGWNFVYVKFSQYNDFRTWKPEKILNMFKVMTIQTQRFTEKVAASDSEAATFSVNRCVWMVIILNTLRILSGLQVRRSLYRENFTYTEFQSDLYFLPHKLRISLNLCPILSWFFFILQIYDLIYMSCGNKI